MRLSELFERYRLTRRLDRAETKLARLARRMGVTDQLPPPEPQQLEERDDGELQ